MSLFYDLQICINGDHTFFLNQDVISKYSGSLRKMIKQSKKKRNKKSKSPEIITIEIDGFPGGSDGFELVSRFCYSNGGISIDVSNVSTLYCCSVFLGMTEKLCFSNLLLQTESFLEEVFYGSWNDIVLSLKSCEQVFLHADSYGLVDKLIFSALTKISRSSEAFSSSSLSSSSPSSAKNTPESDKRLASQNVSCGRSNEWWFDDMSSLSPVIILKLIRIIGAYKTNVKSLVLTKFLLHYLKTRLQTKSRNIELMRNKLEYSDLADTAVTGVVLAGKTAFSCRKLFWVLRVLSSFSLSRESKTGLETLIGEMLDQATLDDLLIPAAGGSRESGFYNVDLVIRLLKVFVRNREEEEEESKMKEVGRLIDKYLREISPDQNLKVSKFLGVAESLPDSARGCFDGVYRAIDIYLQSHPNLTPEDRTKICRCLNYKKLTLETCRQLARNPKIPPDIAIQALKSRCDDQKHRTPTPEVKLVNKSTCRSRRHSQDKKPVMLHHKGFAISEKLAEELKTKEGYNWKVIDRFRERL
ncbi:BTB/POZ domain-containing protein [Raphanus sativus]|uniref:BTB/POZ domain-containing protein At1g50280 n=1 Tax=Raphanus sativus TaxID=3726 RepID=A0A6J0KKL1_RAPSA|nr:BTB/POZ domain-containing protein At1g50280 [Raphanus sativus]XP_056856197.1 BTB/POZ domain-containing protein At1g50280-like [Raphanus sativus]KAJ4867102.1 BTB/POZ domain-containing protein [Raphanus sativus]KAJ4867907.1 BTB/POZ domain-containing protein [Raphanus sativus]